MYLVRIDLDRTDPDVRAMLGDCQKMHNFVTDLFDSDRKENNILYRMKPGNGNIQLYMYADSPVSKSHEGLYNISQRDISEFVESTKTDMVFQFNILASPSKKVFKDGSKNSQRRILRLPDERTNWLKRKAEQSGFMILTVSELGQQHQIGRHNDNRGGTMALDAYQYQGVLRITDSVLFQKALKEGIGPGKAYGCGMLLLKQY